MSGIRRLPPEVANRIAAGEVVERPASLAKELVENSLDAGATSIDVTFEGGGIDLVRVSDDGEGIPSDEVRLSFERHATSKVWDPKDLVRIDTLGFRGEALASIAAVSRVEMITASADGPHGTRIRIEGGEVREETGAARPPGTTIEISDLFFNVPARRKFLRTAATEGRVLVRTIGQLALGAPHVAFRVVREGRQVIDLGPRDDFRTRVTALLGNVARRMVEVKADRDGISVRGLVAPAEFARTRQTHQVLIVNGRAVTDASLAHAVTAGIGGAAPGGRYPIFALSIRLDPADIDVNVHPTKREVRFTRRDRVFSVIREAVGAAVFETRFDELGRSGGLPWSRSGGPPAAAPVWTEERRRSSELLPEPEPEPEPGAESGRQSPGREAVEVGEPDEGAVPASTALATGRLRLVGELWGAYLLVEDANRLLVIDQHAAHERVLYDEIREAATDPARVPVQGLLVPLSVDLAPGQDPEEASAQLREVGFEAGPGGPSSILVHGVPGNLSRWGGGDFLREVFASAESARAGAEKRIDYLAKTYACKSAVKFGRRLHPEEIDHLLRSLERTEVPRLCPHGRPIFLEVSRRSLDDRFER